MQRMAQQEQNDPLNLREDGDQDEVGVPDYLDLQGALQALAHAKAILTRRINAFCALLNGNRNYARDELVTARTHMVAACDNMVAEMAVCRQFGLGENHPTYTDGIARQNNCMEYYGEVYEARLADFVDGDSTAEPHRDNGSNHDSQHPSVISSAGAAELREELRRNEQNAARELRRRQRARQRQLEEERIAEETRRRLEREEREARLQREMNDRVLALRQQELEDEQEAEADAMLEEQRRARAELEAVLSERSGTGNGSVRSRRTRSMASVVPSLARNNRRAPSAAPSRSSLGTLNLLFEDPGEVGGDNPPPIEPRANPLPQIAAVVEQEVPVGQQNAPQLEVQPALDADPIQNADGAPEPHVQRPLARPLDLVVNPARQQALVQRQPPREAPRQMAPTPGDNLPPTPAPRAAGGGLAPHVNQMHAQIRNNVNLPPAVPTTNRAMPRSRNRLSSTPIGTNLGQDAPFGRQANADLRERLELQERQLILEEKKTAEIKRQFEIAKDLAQLRTAGGHSSTADGRAPNGHPAVADPSKTVPKSVALANTNANCNATAQTSLTAYAPHQSAQYLPLPYPQNQHLIPPNQWEKSLQKEPPVEKVTRFSEVPSPTLSGSTADAGNPHNDYMAAYLLQNLGPKQELFKGDPDTYQRFILDYERAACRLRSRPEMCFQILRGMLAGKALDSIARYEIEEDPAVALKEALATLKLSFGTPEKQCRAQLEALLALPKIKDTEAAFLKFDGDLDTCFRIMKRCNRVQDLDASQVLKVLFKKLPGHVQNRWDKAVLKTPDQKPTYALLMKVVKEEHRRKTSEINYWREESRLQKKDPPKDTKHTKVNQTQVIRSSGPTETGDNTVPPTTRTCLCGPQGGHTCLAECPTYQRAPDVEARWKLIKPSGVCFRCLKFGHLANRCRVGACERQGCRGRHHITLHKDKPVNSQGGQPAGRPPAMQQAMNPQAPPFPPPPGFVLPPAFAPGGNGASRSG